MLALPLRSTGESSLHPFAFPRHGTIPATGSSTMPKRPKLSLQTITPPSAARSKPPNSIQVPPEDTFIHVLGAPGNVDAHRRPFLSVTARPSSRPQLSGRVSTKPPTSSAEDCSTLQRDFPYTLPRGTRSILRNSPLPEQQQPAASNQRCHGSFVLMKRVNIWEGLVEVIPAPAIEKAMEGEGQPGCIETEAPLGQDGALSSAKQEQYVPIKRNSKRAREWIWRPIDDDILAVNEKTESVGDRLDSSDLEISTTTEESNDTMIASRMIP